MPRALDQTQVADCLTADAKKMMRDRIEIPARDMVLAEWQTVRDDIRAYAAGVWNQMNATDDPMMAELAKQRITEFMDEKLRMFRNEAVGILDTAKRQAFKQQFLMDHWILDQVTPPNIQVKPKRSGDDYTPAGGVHRRVGSVTGKLTKPKGGGVQGGELDNSGAVTAPIPKSKTREVQGFDWGGGRSGEGGKGGSWFDEPLEGQPNEDEVTGNAVASHEQRVDAFLKAWMADAFAGLVMGVVQGYSPNDIDARIGETRADGTQMEYALSLLLSTEVQISIGDADDAFITDFGNMVQERRWQTMEDERVCPTCKPNNGKTPEKATTTIPAHPRCRCYWRTVPASYKGLAGDAAVSGAKDGAMVIRDPQTGKTIGTVLVSFDDWSQAVAN